MRDQYITVIIPTANCRRWLSTVIDSMLHQTYPYIELYVVDDASGDLDAQLVGKYPNVNFLRMKKSSGPYVIDNMMIKLTDSQYVAFQDADDWSHPRRFEYQVQHLKTMKWDGCGTWSTHVDLYGNPIGFETFPKNASQAIHTGYQYPLRHPTSLFHRYVLNELGGFDNETRFGADTEFLFRAFLSFDIGNVQQFLYKHTIHPASLTQNADTGFSSQKRKEYNTPLLGYMEAILSGKQPAPQPGYLLNNKPAGAKHIETFGIIQMNPDNKTWIAG